LKAEDRRNAPWQKGTRSNAEFKKLEFHRDHFAEIRREIVQVSSGLEKMKAADGGLRALS
jgi:hypothetical protein